MIIDSNAYRVRDGQSAAADPAEQSGDRRPRPIRHSTTVRDLAAWRRRVQHTASRYVRHVARISTVQLCSTRDGG